MKIGYANENRFGRIEMDKDDNDLIVIDFQLGVDPKLIQNKITMLNNKNSYLIHLIVLLIHLFTKIENGFFDGAKLCFTLMDEKNVWFDKSLFKKTRMTNNLFIGHIVNELCWLEIIDIKNDEDNKITFIKSILSEECYACFYVDMQKFIIKDDLQKVLDLYCDAFKNVHRK